MESSQNNYVKLPKSVPVKANMAHRVDSNMAPLKQFPPLNEVVEVIAMMACCVESDMSLLRRFPPEEVSFDII